MEWFECKGDVEGVEGGKDCESGVWVFELGKVLLGRSGGLVISAGPLSGFGVSGAFWACGHSRGSFTPGADRGGTPVEGPRLDTIIEGGEARARIVRVRHIAIRI